MIAGLQEIYRPTIDSKEDFGAMRPIEPQRAVGTALNSLRCAIVPSFSTARTYRPRYQNSELSRCRDYGFLRQVHSGSRFRLSGEELRFQMEQGARMFVWNLQDLEFLDGAALRMLVSQYTVLRSKGGDAKLLFRKEAEE